MKIQHVAIAPTKAALEAGRHALQPELLASVGARYSRTDEGLDAILARIDPIDPEASIDAIFRHIDYGHKSIMDMAPVSMFLDGLSVWAIYWIWSQVSIGSGQETSTRYCKFNVSGLPAPGQLGIEGMEAAVWLEDMQAAFDAYHEAYELWSEVFARDPKVAGIPQTLIDQTNAGDTKARKTVERMQRNYAFDRARCWIPAAATSNQALGQPASEWVFLIQKLLSHPLPEFNEIGKHLKAELALVTPRLIRHASAKPYWAQGFVEELEDLRAQRPHPGRPNLHPEATLRELTASDQVYLEIFPPSVSRSAGHGLGAHPNRYAHVGKDLRRTMVRWNVPGVDLACIRDMNRHRPGYRYAEHFPTGFYWAGEEVPEWAPEVRERLSQLALVGKRITARALALMEAGDPTYVYRTLLGTQFMWEHGTTADKLVYQTELRTGPGAHYKYARIYRGILEKWYSHYPEHRGLILEGSAEPE